jgi:hypothetical protein
MILLKYQLILSKEWLNLLPPRSVIFLIKSIEGGVFPSYLKKAKVIPVFKANDPTDINNYLPISILPIV